MKEKMKRRDKKEKCFFFLRNVSEPSNPPDELAENVSKKKSPSDELFLHFSVNVQNLAVFSFIYMIRIRFFGALGINSEWVRNRTVRGVQCEQHVLARASEC